MKEVEIDYLKKRNNLLEKLTELYIFIIIVIFPLCVDSTGFFKILECKYKCYLIIAITYIAISLTAIIYYYIFHKIRPFKNIKLSKVQYVVIAFWGINIISCVLSPYRKKYNLLLGVGRGEGLINMSLYCITFLLISLFENFEKDILHTFQYLQYV